MKTILIDDALYIKLQSVTKRNPGTTINEITCAILEKHFAPVPEEDQETKEKQRANDLFRTVFGSGFR